MIPDIFLGFWYALIKVFIDILPKASFPTSITTSVNSLFAGVWQWNGVFPIDTLFSLLQLSMAFWIAVLGWRISKWVLNQIRGN